MDMDVAQPLDGQVSDYGWYFAEFVRQDIHVKLIRTFTNRK